MKKLFSILCVLALATAVGAQDIVPPGTTMDLTAADQAVGVSKIFYRINGGEAQEYSQPLVFTDQGPYTVYHWSEDLLGNAGAPQTVSFTVDATAPTWKWATRGPSLVKDGVVLLKSTTGILVLANDNLAGVASVAFSLDKESSIPFKDEAFVAEAGEKSAWISATDKVGNQSEPAELKLFVDDKAPDVSIVPVEPLLVQNGNRYTKPGNQIAVRAEDEAAGVRVIEVSVNRQEFFTYNEPVLLTEPGEYSFRARAVDNLGNVSAVQDLTFTVDAAHPVNTAGKLTPPGKK